VPLLFEEKKRGKKKWVKGLDNSGNIEEHYPDLRTIEQQERLAAELRRQTKEDTRHGEA
jgi:hypothetical protein